MFALHFNTCFEVSSFENLMIFNIQEFSVNIRRRGEEKDFARNESIIVVVFLDFKFGLVMCLLYMLTHVLMKVSRIRVNFYTIDRKVRNNLIKNFRINKTHHCCLFLDFYFITIFRRLQQQKEINLLARKELPVYQTFSSLRKDNAC